MPVLEMLTPDRKTGIFSGGAVLLMQNEPAVNNRHHSIMPPGPRDETLEALYPWHDEGSGVALPLG